MMTKTTTMCLYAALLLLLLPSSLHAVPRFEPQLSITLDRAQTDPEYRGEGYAPTLLFVGDVPTIRVKLLYSPGDDAKARRKGPAPAVPDFVLPGSDWMSFLELTLEDESGNVPAGFVMLPGERGWTRHAAEKSTGGEEFRLAHGEGAFSTFKLQGLPAGDYELRGTLRIGDRVVAKAHVRIATRVGSESSAVRKALLQFRLDRAKTFEEYQAISLQLANENPNEFVVLEKLADRSIGKLEPALTKEYYRRAREARQRGLGAYREAHGGNVPVPYVTMVQVDLERLSVYERVAPILEQYGSTIALTPTLRGGRKWFAWTDKHTGEFIEDVDLEHPDSFRSRIR